MTLPTSNAAGLHVRYEMAGLVLDSLPIPWNADAVIVEANVRLPKAAPGVKQDFTLRLAADALPATAELIAPQSKKATRVFFRIPVPADSCVAQIFWREHSLGHVELPILALAAFDRGFTLDMPTLHVVLGDRTVACGSFVATQAKILLASAVVRSASPLAAALTMGLRVEVQHKDGESIGSAHVPFTTEQLRTRQTLVTVQLPKLRGVGSYVVSWHLANRSLHTQRIATVSRKTLLRSLRISATRFHVTNDDGTKQIVRSLPTRDGQLLLDGIAEVAPVFFVCSGERGMAGLVPFALSGSCAELPTIGETLLVTDGPTAILLGVTSADTLRHIKHFTLAADGNVLGNLSVLPAPKAEFSAEGGFAPLDDFLWSPAAEEQLNERLGKLLDDA